MTTSERFTHPSRFLIVGVAALGLTMAVVSPPPAFAGRGDDIVVPEVPANLQVEAGHTVYRKGVPYSYSSGRVHAARRRYS